MWKLRKNAVLFMKKCVLVLISILVLVFLLHPGRFAPNYPYIDKTDIPKNLVPVPHYENLTKPLCPLVPKVVVNSFNFKAKQYKLDDSSIMLGGSWKPSHCSSQHKIAVVVPYRNRADQLEIFMSYIHGFLQDQLIEYHIYVIEQIPGLLFNRALLFNIGYVEVLKFHQIPCFIFHDVDLIPENLENVYGCTSFPRHMSSSVNTLRYNLPYVGLFGGVVSMLQAQFHMINGFPNRYFGWGGEDDDLYRRILAKGLSFVRFSPEISRYYMLPHRKEALETKNLIHLENAFAKQDVDGLSNIKSSYKVLQYDMRPLYTNVMVELFLPEQKNGSVSYKVSESLIVLICLWSLYFLK